MGIDLFSSGTTPSKLTAVNLSLHDVQTAEDVGAYIYAIASGCHTLAQIKIHHRSEVLINMSYICSIFAHPKLKRLALVMAHNIQDSDIETISVALPNLTELTLTPSTVPVQCPSQP